MLIQFLVALGLLSLGLGTLLAIAGIWALRKYRKNGALFLGLSIIVIGIIALSIAQNMSAAV